MAEVATLDKEKLNDFYIKTLLFSEKIKDKVPEKKNLYLDAFFGLVRNGYHYDVEEKFPDKGHKHLLEGKKNKGKKTEDIFDANPSITGDPVRTLVIKIDDEYYRCPEVDLQYAFGTLYEKVTASKKKKKVVNDVDILLPDIYSKGYVEKAEKDVAIATGTAAPAEEEKVLIPYVAFDTNYPSDGDNFKEYDTFLFNYHETRVRFRNGKERIYKTYVYPLNPDMSDILATDIVAVMIDPEGNIRPNISEPGPAGQKSVNEEFKDITLVVRGGWEDRKFTSSVALMSYKGTDDEPVVVDPEPQHVIATKRTSAFYLRHIEENGNVLNVFPLGLLRNDSRSGLAPCVMMIEDGKTRTMYLSGDNNPIAMTLNKKSVLASAYWTGTRLNLGIDIKR